MLKPNKKAIGIFGGSFDPPHRAHIEISKISLNKIKLKKVYWIVSKKNPFKNKSFFSLKHRVQMSKKASKKYKNIEILYLDDKIKSSRMIKVINHFKKIKRQYDLYLSLIYP